MSNDDYEGDGNGTMRIEEEELDNENNAETRICESEECPPETSAQFWLRAAAYEQAPGQHVSICLRNPALSSFLQNQWTNVSRQPNCGG